MKLSDVSELLINAYKMVNEMVLGDSKWKSIIALNSFTQFWFFYLEQSPPILKWKIFACCYISTFVVTYLPFLYNDVYLFLRFWLIYFIVANIASAWAFSLLIFHFKFSIIIITNFINLKIKYLHTFSSYEMAKFSSFQKTHKVCS